MNSVHRMLAALHYLSETNRETVTTQLRVDEQTSITVLNEIIQMYEQHTDIRHFAQTILQLCTST